MLTTSLSALVLGCLAHDGLRGVAARPNFIVMQPDDLQFGSLWTPPAHLPGETAFSYGDLLPNLEAFRADGLQMMRAHAASPMCGTSRYSTVTGRYPSRSSLSRQRQDDATIQDVTIPMTKLADRSRVVDGNDCSENNLAAVLQANGYETGMVGKWHLYNDNGVEYSYANVQSEIMGCGFSAAEGVYYENLADGWTNNGEFTHNMEYITEHAITFIDDAIGDSKSFFLYFNPTAPHNSGNVYDALTSGSCLDTPEGTLDTEPVVVGMTEGSDCATYRASVVSRAAGSNSNSILGAIWVDDAVGSLMQHLEDIGELDNTFFLFQMDHGQEGKQSIYETGSRLAQFIHYPDSFAAGTQFNGLVSTIDIAPTILDYAGVTSSYSMDGKSWKTAVAENDVTWNERCVVVEADTDRGVTCGCDKYLLLDTEAGDTETIATGTANGLVVTTGLMNLCDDFGNYLTSPDETPETATVTDDETSTRLEAVLTCHLSMTKPDIDPEYGLCDTLLLPDSTSAPQASPVTPSPSSTILSGCTCDADTDISEHYYTEEQDGGNLVLTTAGIPNHVYHTEREKPNPRQVCIQPVTITLPLTPQLGDSLTDTGLGVIGVLKTGAFMYNHKSNRDGVDDVANHPDNEQVSLDKCHGHADSSCRYHYHEMSQLAECTHDDQWDECEHIGYMLDGFKVYSHCYYEAKARFLSSCYVLDSDVDNGGGDDTSDYTHIMSSDCDLDAANGIDFTGLGILDNDGNAITGYAYVATSAYPYVMPKYAGTTWNRAVSIAWPLEEMPVPSTQPTTTPSTSPVFSPSNAPSTSPTASPTSSPSATPSSTPTASPSSSPSTEPTSSPVSEPASEPSSMPSTADASTPTTSPLATPSAAPSIVDPSTPTSAPFQSEVDNGNGGGPNCFSSANTVDVRGKGIITMDNLEVGDFVKASNGKYSQVYSLGHFEPSVEGTFLTITLEGTSSFPSSSLEVTVDHIVFVKPTGGGRRMALAASEVKVGDILIGESEPNAMRKILHVESIQRRGLYAPVTNDGTMEVSGVLASSYVVLSPEVSAELQHTFFHSLCFPIRALCVLSFETFCANESHDAEGISKHFSQLIAIGKMIRKYIPPRVQSTGMLLLSPFVLCVYFLERNVLLLVGISVVAAWLVRRLRIRDLGDGLEEPLLSLD